MHEKNAVSASGKRISKTITGICGDAVRHRSRGHSFARKGADRGRRKNRSVGVGMMRGQGANRGPIAGAHVENVAAAGRIEVRDELLDVESSRGLQPSLKCRFHFGM